MSPPLPAPDPSGPRRSDDELLVRSGQGDVAAFAELLRRHQGAVYRYCWRIFRSHHAAEDLSQDFFWKLYRNAPNYVPEGHFTTFMYRVLTNLCFDALRRKKRRAKTETLHLDPVACEGTELEPVDAPTDFDARMAGAEAKDAIHEALGSLPEQVRKCVELREFEGLSYREIARVTDHSPTEVKVILHRGRKLLARRLANTPVGRQFGVDGRHARRGRGEDGR